MQHLLTICPSETRRQGWLTCCFFSFLQIFFSWSHTKHVERYIYGARLQELFQMVSIHQLDHTSVPASDSKKKCLTYKKCLFWIMFATTSPVLTSCQICPITRCICVFADAEIFNVSKGHCLLLTGIKYIDQAHAFFFIVHYVHRLNCLNIKMTRFPLWQISPSLLKVLNNGLTS